DVVVDAVVAAGVVLADFVDDFDAFDELDELEPQPASTSPASSSETAAFLIDEFSLSRCRPRTIEPVPRLVKTSHNLFTQVAIRFRHALRVLRSQLVMPAPAARSARR